MTLESSPTPDVPLMHVVAGVLSDHAGRVLLAERPAGKAFAGRWEFPGGKLEHGEAARQALTRELREELGVEVLDAEPLLAVRHRYPGAPVRVLIDSWRVLSWRGVPAALDGQRLRWCETAELAHADILEADRPIVTALRLPRVLAEGAGSPRMLRDPPAVPPGAIAIYSSCCRLVPAADREALAGCIVTDAASSRLAAERGADFLLLASPVDDETCAMLAVLGLPWYLDDRGGAPTGARAIGVWRQLSEG